MYDLKICPIYSYPDRRVFVCLLHVFLMSHKSCISNYTYCSLLQYISITLYVVKVSKNFWNTAFETWASRALWHSFWRAWPSRSCPINFLNSREFFSTLLAAVKKTSCLYNYAVRHIFLECDKSVSDIIVFTVSNYFMLTREIGVLWNMNFLQFFLWVLSVFIFHISLWSRISVIFNVNWWEWFFVIQISTLYFRSLDDEQIGSKQTSTFRLWVWRETDQLGPCWYVITKVLSCFDIPQNNLIFLTS